MHLEFEKPIVDLEAKLNEMKRLASDNGVDVTDAVHKLEDKIIRLKEETFTNLTRWQRVQLSRHPDRPYTLDYIYEITNEFIELHGDRAVSDDKAMIGGLGEMDGQSVMFIGQQKG
ncbi:MAG: acetyl-CoA carboxylase carboxyl transferase subunit alpha, partial [Imperialibacter sp.]